MVTTGSNSTSTEAPPVPAGEAQLLVSEFPPPPFYYNRAPSLTPPEIPTEALERASNRAAALAAKAKEEAERQRLQLPQNEEDATKAVLGGVTGEEEAEDGDVVAVFGEIVEVRVICIFLLCVHRNGVLTRFGCL